MADSTFETGLTGEAGDARLASVAGTHHHMVRFNGSNAAIISGNADLPRLRAVDKLGGNDL